MARSTDWPLTLSTSASMRFKSFFFSSPAALGASARRTGVLFELYDDLILRRLFIFTRSRLKGRRLVFLGDLGFLILRLRNFSLGKKRTLCARGCEQKRDREGCKKPASLKDIRLLS